MFFNKIINMICLQFNKHEIFTAFYYIKKKQETKIKVDLLTNFVCSK